MKIAVSGSAGTGKTTLAAALAADQGCSIVAEHYDDFFGDDQGFIRSAHRLQRRIFEVLELKNRIENECGDFVADRCPADLFNLWLSRGFGRNHRITAELYNRCRSYIRKYDCIVVLPWDALPLKQVDGGASRRRRRVMNRWVQLYNQSTVIGLLAQWVVPDRLLPVPFAVTGSDARVEFVAGSLRSSQGPG